MKPDFAAGSGIAPFRRAGYQTFVCILSPMSISFCLGRNRLNTACELLKHSQKNVSEICCMVGFSDLPHFVRVFTRTMGVSPSRYRKRFRAAASVYR